MRNETREQRRRRRRRRRTAGTVTAVVAAILAVILIFTILLPALQCLPEPEEEVSTAQLYAARFYAQERYYELLERGYDEWSAQQAAELLYEELMEVKE